MFIALYFYIVNLLIMTLMMKYFKILFDLFYYCCL
uniref:Uncharacterized protein n=1 Tax=Chondria sp. (in: red algae) TaxID=1982705 RepID=A0A1Z1MQU4_9FLOR|nr:hypothetical protein [Chondria sp. (in: red algae)]